MSKYFYIYSNRVVDPTDLMYIYITAGKTGSGHEKGACLFIAESELTLEVALKD